MMNYSVFPGNSLAGRFPLWGEFLEFQEDEGARPFSIVFSLPAWQLYHNYIYQKEKKSSPRHVIMRPGKHGNSAPHLLRDLTKHGDGHNLLPVFFDAGAGRIAGMDSVRYAKVLKGYCC